MTLPPDLHGEFPVHVGEPAPPVPIEDDVPVVERRRRRIRLVPRSLSARLVAGVVALVILLVVLIGGGTFFALRYFLYERLDQQVSSTAVQNARFIGGCLSTGSPVCANTNGPPPTTTEWLAILNSDGTAAVTIRNNPFFKALTLSDPTGASITANPDTARTINADGVRLRVVAKSIANGIVVVTGLPTQEVDRTLNRLILLEVVIGGTAIALAFLLTSYGVRASLSNLYRVTDTATEVAAELSPEGAGLDRRVPVVEEGTEVGRLAESMNTLLAAVETQFAARLESEERMRQFLADASHELRTPLTSIRGYAELARMQRAAGNPDEDNLGRIESEGTRMSRLVEDLLMLARDDQDAIPRIELVDIADTVDDAVSGVRAANPQRSIVVEAVPSYNVVGDPDQLVRVIRNLLANAVVHTPPGSPISVRAFVDGPGVAVQVVDGGPGLPAEEASHVFERFWRADKARTRARGGSGLGLSIVASIVAAHGGAAHFESTVEGGSTVTVWLPGVTT